MTADLGALREALAIIEFLGKLHRSGDPLALQQGFDYVNARQLPNLHRLLLAAQHRVEAANRAGICHECWRPSK